jgi:nucleotide-binding universal stress UspA family protein
MTGIVVGIDGSPGAAVALRWAVQEGKTRDLPVTAVLAWGLLTQHQAVIGPDFDPHYDPDHALAALRTYVHEAIEAEDFDKVELRVVNDLAAPGLLAAASDADLLVVGGRGLGGFKSLLLGSVSSHCLHHASGPVAVVHESWTPAAPGSHPKIIVAIDGSDHAQAALAWAAREAKARDADLDIVYVWNVPNAAGYPYVGIGFDSRPFERAAHLILTSAKVDEAVSDLPRIPLRTAVQGHPATAILDHAKDADLIVLGSRGLGGFQGLLLGSTSQQVTHHATCPVVVVPTGR